MTRMIHDDLEVGREYLDREIRGILVVENDGQSFERKLIVRLISAAGRQSFAKASSLPNIERRRLLAYGDSHLEVTWEVAVIGGLSNLYIIANSYFSSNPDMERISRTERRAVENQMSRISRFYVVSARPGKHHQAIWELAR